MVLLAGGLGGDAHPEQVVLPAVGPCGNGLLWGFLQSKGSSLGLPQPAVFPGSTGFCLAQVPSAHRTLLGTLCVLTWAPHWAVFFSHLKMESAMGLIRVKLTQVNSQLIGHT